MLQIAAAENCDDQHCDGVSKTLCQTIRGQAEINNAAVLQAFGISNSRMAQQLTDVLDCPAADLVAMGNQELRRYMKGQGSRTCRRSDYLNDMAFAGLWDVNPFFDKPLSSGISGV